VTPRGFAARWTVHETLRKFWVIDSRPGAEPIGVPVATVWNDSAGIDLGEPRPKPTTLTPGQVEADRTMWAGPRLEAGLWSCTPGDFTTHRDGFDEIMHILSGAGSVTADDGARIDFGPGTTFVLPDGYRGTWSVTEAVRKVYCIVTRR
jgi:hypothetical protein